MNARRSPWLTALIIGSAAGSLTYGVLWGNRGALFTAGLLSIATLFAVRYGWLAQFRRPQPPKE